MMHFVGVNCNLNNAQTFQIGSDMFVYLQDHVYWPVALWHSMIFPNEKTFQVGRKGQVNARTPVVTTPHTWWNPHRVSS